MFPDLFKGFDSVRPYSTYVENGLSYSEFGWSLISSGLDSREHAPLWIGDARSSSQPIFSWSRSALIPAGAYLGDDDDDAPE